MAEDLPVEDINEDEAEALEVEFVLLQLGVTEAGQWVAAWKRENIDRLRKSLTPEQLEKIIELAEASMTHFIGALCGGRQ